MARKYQNLETQRLHDKSKTSSANKGITDKHTPSSSAAGHSGAGEHSENTEQHRGGDDQNRHEEIKSVVAQHGPAHAVHIEHDHAAGLHHVESHHGSTGASSGQGLTNVHNPGVHEAVPGSESTDQESHGALRQGHGATHVHHQSFNDAAVAHEHAKFAAGVSEENEDEQSDEHKMEHEGADGTAGHKKGAAHRPYSGAGRGIPGID